MAKRLSKTLWYGTGLDAYGKPLLPPVATNESDLNGLHRGELFMHLDKDNVTLWSLSSNNEVVQIAGKQGEIDIDLSDYLLKSTWDKVWELRKDNNGVEYIYSKLPVVTRYGITMYADNGGVEVESIYAGLPIDNVTLYWDNGVLKAKGGEGGGGVADSIAWANVYGKPSWVTDTKPIYNYSEIKNTPDLSVFVTGAALSNTLANYATLPYLTGELKKYVTIKDDQDIVGVKNFLNGIKISDIPIIKLQDDVIYIDANVVVRGGVTMYADGGSLNIPSIYDGLPIDGVTLVWEETDEGKVLKINPNIELGGGLDEDELNAYLTNNNYAKKSDITAALSGYATTSSLNAVSTKLNDFLEGSDTDTVINKWKELEIFLSGLSESDNLATILSTKWTTDNNLINQWNTAYGWGNHASVGYALKSYVDGELAKYVTIGTKQTITGEKNFTGGLRVNNSPSIYYDATKKYWKLEGDLLVTGGVTMYGTDEGDLPSILDSLPIASTTSLGVAMFDSTYFKVASSGKVTLLPDNVGLNESRLNSYLTTNNYLTQTKADARYLSIEGGTLNGALKAPQMTIYMDVDTSRVRGLYWVDTSGSTIASLYYYNTAKKFILNPVGSTDAHVNEVGKYNLIIGENTLTYNTYNVLHSNNYADNITKRNVVINGSKWTVFSSVETDTTGVYAPTSIGTANQVLVSSGSGAPTWANQSTLSVDSATKLQTARTIWGQSFNGTANIDGAFYMKNNTYIYFKNASGSNMIGMYASTSGNLIIGAGVASIGNSTYIDGNTVRLRYGTNSTLGFILNDAGNVGFGTDSPNYKVHAIGTGDFSNGINYSTATSSFNSLGIKFATDLARISVSSTGNMGIYAKGVVSIRGNSQSESSGTGLTIDESGNASLTGKLTLAGTDANTALLEFSRDGYNYITFPNTLSIGISTAGADRLLVINSTSATFQCNIMPHAHATYHLGEWGNAFTRLHANAIYAGSNTSSLWLVGGKSADNYGVVIGRNTTGTTSGAEICRFNANGLVWASGVYGDIRTTDTNIYLRRAGLNTNTVLLANGYFSPYSEATDLLQLGRPTARWKGVFVGVGTTGNNEYGLQFCDTSGNYVGRISHSTIMGIYSTGDIVIRGGCTKGTSNLTASSSGLRVYASGDILATGGITMYSDIRKKTKLQDVELSLCQISNAPLIQHYYNSDQNKTTHVGSIAQYWYEMNNWFCKEDSDGFLTMEIQNCALASAISIARHLERYESKTDKQIRKLKQRIQELEDKLEMLEGGNHGC